MASFVPTSDDTLEDRRLYTEARQTTVACLDCLAEVGVKKNSEHHTAIQWSSSAQGSCPVLSRRAASADARSVHAGCPRMEASIEAAAREGRIPLGAEDGY
ncbi:hypothetical protein [Nocardioides sp.]|uniref:hypothetical protein n=1 Tax=Nocardioides sp. TaxID=35761 RepID=UPI000C943D55|nr:hypothetical protein [Nocardioides sp.]MAS54535.1 hypothetical protein [Pimelobacter sp.]MDE0779058.1 hypothetical protein [Nocardioides sp.]